MPDNRFDGKRVSDEWDTILTAARRAGVDFHLNSGRRTMAEQWFLWNHRGQPGFASLVAFPSPTAPHIRVGRIDHAIDVQTGGEDRLQTWLRSRGVRAVNNVTGEPWHLEAPASQLRRLAARLTAEGQYPLLKKGVVNREATRRLQRMLRALGVKGVPLNGRYDLATRMGVKRWQKKHRLVADGVVGPATWRLLIKRVHA